MKKEVSIYSTIMFLALLALILVLIFQDYKVSNVKENLNILLILYFLIGIGLLFIGAIFYYSKSTSISKKDGRYKNGFKVIGTRTASKSEIESNQNEGKLAFKSGITLLILALILLLVTKMVL